MGNHFVWPWNKHYWSRFPWGLFFAIALLSTISLLFIQSASYNSSLGITLPFAKRQLVRLIFSLVICLLIGSLPLQKTEEWAMASYFLGIFLLILVFFLARSVKGAARWIPVGPIRIQPSEFMKLFLILGLSAYLSKREIGGWKDLFMPFVITLIPLFLVLKQPDLGTSLLFLPLLFWLLYIKKSPLRPLIIIGFSLILFAILAWNFHGVNQYQKNRVYAFLYPKKYARTIAYQQIQSQIAIGSGGFWGKGLYRGSQTQLNFLPERHTDFIFAVLSEEWGFVGAGAVLVLLFLMIVFLLEISLESQNSFGSLFAFSLAVLLGIQSFINVGIALGILPVTGLTLPFVSYGGSSTLMFWMALGVVIQVNRE